MRLNYMYDDLPSDIAALWQDKFPGAPLPIALRDTVEDGEEDPNDDPPKLNPPLSPEEHTRILGLGLNIQVGHTFTRDDGSIMVLKSRLVKNAFIGSAGLEVDDSIDELFDLLGTTSEYEFRNSGGQIPEGYIEQQYWEMQNTEEVEPSPRFASEEVYLLQALNGNAIKVYQHREETDFIEESWDLVRGSNQDLLKIWRKHARLLGKLGLWFSRGKERANAPGGGGYKRCREEFEQLSAGQSL
eukprot:2286438-Prymnesium_polylepis.1